MLVCCVVFSHVVAVVCYIILFRLSYGNIKLFSQFDTIYFMLVFVAININNMGSSVGRCAIYERYKAFTIMEGTVIIVLVFGKTLFKRLLWL